MWIGASQTRPGPVLLRAVRDLTGFQGPQAKDLTTGSLDRRIFLADLPYLRGTTH